MEKRIIKTIIHEKQQEIASTELIERPIFLEESCNYLFVGLRRAGKSYLMFQHIQSLIKSGKAAIEDILYINFEDERIASIKVEELNQLLEAYREMYENKRPLIYLDEIQNVEGWEHFARRLTDSKYRVYITGSNAKMLSREMATTLGGRYIIKEIYPFSLSEYLSYKKIKLSKNWEYTDDRMTIAKLFEDYFRFGGFPETFELKDKRSWINSLYLKILLGDIITRNEIRNADAIRLLARKLAESVMQPTTLSRLQHIVSSAGVKVGRNTITDYIGYMKDAYLIFGIANFTDSLSERETSQKRYFCDNGLLNVFLSDPQTKLLENIVALALMRRYGNEELFYYNKNSEVDFYLPSQKMAVQASFRLSEAATFERETKALVKMAGSFDIEKAVIVTYDDERTIDVGGVSIAIVPVWKWLLNIEGL
ncbi:MAG: ATP-binding protein [Odoribacter sp.]